ncbi:nickel-dependent lactate racemase [Alkalihalobacillus oceani]|uniref:lactate racemase domain-containing protein n=1 Tax=Halalkalibacter oceani TaxID=1653776 RepID=UPI00203F1FDD|nr:lactate racemase domain-containing protein [Halalkalibacter oceani]MCM3760318.1 nickel-dependent lactate racemase [Halalkalibacter oceani]
MLNQELNVKLAGGYELDLPKMYLVKQKFDQAKLESIPAAVKQEIGKESIKRTVKKGDSIAVAVGSRGIANLFEIVRAVVKELQGLGAVPFVLPAMGSHGGATDEGQKQVLASYGITEESIGAEIKSSMEVIELGTTETGMPVYLDKYASEADSIVVINRVKPHTDFKADYESGLMKMMGIGLGKHKGATKMHSYGFDQFERVIPEVGNYVLAHSKIIFGVAILENAYDKTKKIEAIPAGEIASREKELLVEAKALLPKILVPEIDVLIVNEIGKDISGSGMDPNITGKVGSGLPGFEAPPIQKVIVLDLTEKTHGNACGIGMADVTTRRLVEKIDFNYTYANSITSTVLEPAKIPVAMNNDKEALVVALRTCNRITIPEAKIVRIHNTLELGEIMVSEAAYQLIKDQENIELIEGPFPLSFDENGFINDNM